MGVLDEGGRGPMWLLGMHWDRFVSEVVVVWEAGGLGGWELMAWVWWHCIRSASFTALSILRGFFSKVIKSTD